MQYFCRLLFLRIVCVISTLKVNPSWCFNGLGSKMAQFQHVGSCLASQTCWKQRKGVAWLVQDFLNGMGRVQRGAGISCGVIFFYMFWGFSPPGLVKFSLKKNKICKPGKQQPLPSSFRWTWPPNFQQSSCLYKQKYAAFLRFPGSNKKWQNPESLRSHSNLVLFVCLPESTVPSRFESPDSTATRFCWCAKKLHHIECRWRNSQRVA